MTTMETTTRRVTYPGPELPAVPAFSVDVPDGYVALPAPGLLAVITPREEPDGFRPNVTITGGLVTAGTTPGELLDTVAMDSAKQHPGLQVPRRIDDESDNDVVHGATQRMTFTMDGTDIEQVVTVHVLDTAVAGQFAHVFTVTSSWATSADTDGEALRAIHTSFSVTGARVG